MPGGAARNSSASRCELWRGRFRVEHARVFHGERSSQQLLRRKGRLNVRFGYFTMRGEGARGEEDVLNENRVLLAFDLDDFNDGTFGAEWLVPFGECVEGGAGIAFSRRAVPSVFRPVPFREAVVGRVVEQELSLRIVPVSFTKLYEVEDTTFTQAGKVGVWTKADSVTNFDDLTVVTP